MLSWALPTLVTVPEQDTINQEMSDKSLVCSRYYSCMCHYPETRVFNYMEQGTRV